MGSRRRVLVVEDDTLVSETIQLLLQEEGYEVAPVCNAQEAEQLLEANDIQALVTDIFLGRGQTNGWEVARRARELKPELPVIYVTGDSASAWSAQGVPRSELVPKPFQSGHFIAALQRVFPEQH